jgi:hypothetical protein
MPLAPSKLTGGKWIAGRRGFGMERLPRAGDSDSGNIGRIDVSFGVDSTVDVDRGFG